MEIEVDFPGGKRVDARVGAFTIRTDQPIESGGEGAAPSPFDLFLASLATCAGIYVLGFCQARQLPTAGIRMIQRMEISPETKLPHRITLEVRLPVDFPAAYRDALARAAGACKVKKVLANPPSIEVTTTLETRAVAGDAGTATHV